MSFDEHLHAARNAFIGRFGRPPAFIAAAPGRVNLIGEHTDYNRGVALPLAIDRWAIVAASPAAGSSSTLVAHDLADEVTIRLDARPAPHAKPWANYLLGVAAAFIDHGADLPELDVLLHSTVPIGAGLSSSAAIEVAMATLLEQATGAKLQPLEKARLCQRAEHDFAGTPCGIMDQLVIAAAVAGHALLIDFATEQYQPIPLPPPEEATLLVADTGVRRELASSEYAARRATCAAAAEALGLDSLREATLSMLEDEALSDVERKRAAHVVTENTRTLLAAAALGAGDLDTVGDLMFASHDSLRDLYEVSTPELDALVEVSRELRERGMVYGARLTGGGFGGCVVVLSRTDAAELASAVLRDAFASVFERELTIFPVRAVAGADLIRDGR